MRLRLISLVAALGIAVSSARAYDATGDTRVSVYKGECRKAEIGGQNLLADCAGEVVLISYASDVSGMVFSLSGHREVSFTSGDPAVRPSHTSWQVAQVTFKAGSDEHAYKAVSVVCYRERRWDSDTPKLVTCSGQADGQPVSFEFMPEDQQHLD